MEASPTGEPQHITLQDDEERTLEFAVDLLDDAPVSAEHLQEHIDTEWPVLVYFSGSGDEMVAHRIDDAPED